MRGAFILPHSPILCNENGVQWPPPACRGYRYYQRRRRQPRRSWEAARALGHRYVSVFPPNTTRLSCPANRRPDLSVSASNQFHCYDSLTLLSPAPGQWSFPGGHLDQGENLFACAERETLEETGLAIRALKVVAVTNDIFSEPDKHYISIFVKSERIDAQQQPQVRIDVAVRRDRCC